MWVSVKVVQAFNCFVDILLSNRLFEKKMVTPSEIIVFVKIAFKTY